MKKLLLLVSITVSFHSFSQNKVLSYGDAPIFRKSDNIPGALVTINNLDVDRKYNKIDTLSCYFLEANERKFTWNTGYVIRQNGYIKFGKVSVVEDYLPIVTGIATSTILYADKSKVNNDVIRIIIRH